MPTLFSTTQTPEALLLYVFPVIALSLFLSYFLISHCRTLSPSPISALPPPVVACRHLKPVQLPPLSNGTLPPKRTTLNDPPQEPSETTHLLDRPTTTTTTKAVSRDEVPNNQLYSFAFTPGNPMATDSSCDDCRFSENHSGYGTTIPERLVAVGMDVPRDAATAHSKRGNLGGYDGSVKCVGSVWSTTSSIGVNENRLWCADSCDWREELKQRKEEWEDRNRLLAQYAKD